MNKSSQESPLYLIYRRGYQGIYPPFHNPSEFEWTSAVEQNWRVIRDELFASPQLKSMNAPHIKGEDGWKGLYLVNFGWMKHNNIKKFPETMKILCNNVPHLTFAAFSVLEPRASLLPHYGDTNTIIRCVLGIEVPAPAPVCALQVADEVKSWEEGKVIMFSECHLHTAWNHSGRRRIILSFDTMRPEFVNKKRIICARVLAAETIFCLNNAFKWFSFLSKHLYYLFYWMFAAVWWLYLPLQQKLKVLP